MKRTLARETVAEALGTAFLLATVIGSGIMGERLAGGNAAIALLANALATGAALVALILAFGPRLVVQGQHQGPAIPESITGGEGLQVIFRRLGIGLADRVHKHGNLNSSHSGAPSFIRTGGVLVSFPA
jgi:hypothetical protein